MKILSDYGSSKSHKFNTNKDDGIIRVVREMTSKMKRPAEEVSFRIPCRLSVVSALFERPGNGVSTICNDTSCMIDCEDEVPGSDHRVVFIIGSGLVDRRIVFRKKDTEEECGDVSSAQEAVIRFFELAWEVEQEFEGVYGGDDVAYCALLANNEQTRAVIGKRGNSVTKIRRESGAKIRILPPPFCASGNDELIQITGSGLAIKKALVAVTACLHDCPPIQKDPTVSIKHSVRVHSRSSCNSHTAFVPHLQMSQPHLIRNPVNSSSNSPSLPARAHGDPSAQQEISLRMLYSNRAAGGIIGKRGEIINDMQKKSGAFISFSAPLTKSGERVVTISAMENINDRYSPTQRAVDLVFSRSVKVDKQDGFSPGSHEVAAVTARLLVGSNLVGCFTGNGGKVLSEMTQATGAIIQLFRGIEIQNRESQSDSIIEITGTYKGVHNALLSLTERLRHYVLYGNVLSEERVMHPNGRSCHWVPRSSSGHSLRSGKQNISMKGMSQLGPGGNIAGASKLQPSVSEGVHKMASASVERGSSSSTSAVGVELESSKSVFVANTSMEIVVAAHLFDSVYGKGGHNLALLKQISGAKVEVCDPSSGESEGMVVVSGTRDQVLVAQSLLHGFVLAGH